MLGIANRPEGYDEKLLQRLAPLLNTCGNIIAAYRTEQERAAALTELGKSESRIRAIIDTTTDGIITISVKGIIDTFNPAAEAVFGYTAEEIKGQNISRLMPDPYREELLRCLQRYIHKGQSRWMGKEREILGLRRDGSEFPMEFNMNEMLTGASMFTCVVRDISERKKIENIKDEFISTVSHEIRTPLTSIRGSLSLLVNEQASHMTAEQKAAMLNIAQNNSERLLLLIDDLLDIQKIESGRMQYHFTECEVGPFLDTAITINQPYGDQYQVKFVTTDNLVDTWIDADHDRLMQVMSNLLSNAAKFATQRNQVEVSAQRRSGKIRFTVTNYGSPIAKEFRDKVFDKFTQADASDTRRTSGTGLGLSISRAIIDAHHGTINFTSSEHEGTSFFFDLPERKVASDE